MAMGQIQSFPPVRIFQNKSGIKSYVRKERQGALTGRTVKRGAFFFRKGGALFYNIMVSIYHIQPVITIESGKELKHFTVDFFNLLHLPILPEFVAVSQFNIGKAVFVIVL